MAAQLLAHALIQAVADILDLVRVAAVGPDAKALDLELRARNLADDKAGAAIATLLQDDHVGPAMYLGVLHFQVPP